MRLSVPGYPDEHIEWKLAESSEGMLELTDEGAFYRARDSDGLDTVVATLSDQTTIESEIRVIAPQSVHVRRRGGVVTEVTYRPHNGSLVQTVLVDIEFRSASVNFDEIWVEESAAVSQLEGYCKASPESYPDHDRTDAPVPVRFVNETHPFGVRYGNLIVAGNLDFSGDRLEMPTHGRPYPEEGAGSWTWNTRWSFKAGDSEMLELSNPLTPQVMEVECAMEGSEHKVVYRLSKGGVVIVEGHHMNPNDVP